jgi:hypothetical protein
MHHTSCYVYDCVYMQTCTLTAQLSILTLTPSAAYRALVCAFTWRRVLADQSLIIIINPLFSRVFCPALDAQALPGAAG